MTTRTRLRAADVVSETDFQQTVIKMARALGWRVYHTHDSRRSDPGFPDLCMVRDGQLRFMELKSEKGNLTPAQAQWLSAFSWVAAHNDGIHAGLFRPSDMERIKAMLT